MRESWCKRGSLSRFTSGPAASTSWCGDAPRCSPSRCSPDSSKSGAGCDRQLQRLDKAGTIHSNREWRQAVRKPLNPGLTLIRQWLTPRRIKRAKAKVYLRPFASIRGFNCKVPVGERVTLFQRWSG